MSRVLIVEDEKAMSDLITIKFKVEGFEVDQAFTLAEAKTKIGAFSYDAVLTDFLLPDGDLVDFLSLLRSNPQTQRMPVIVMTNYVEDINTDKLKSLGVSEVLVKYQVVPAQMVDKVRQVINVIQSIPPEQLKPEGQG